MRGYLIAVTNPQFSGIATAHFAKSRKAVRKPTPDNVVRVPVEAGFGVRQLMQAFKDAGHHPINPATAPAVRYTVDEFGLLQSVELEA